MDEITERALQEWFRRYPESDYLYRNLPPAQAERMLNGIMDTIEFNGIRLKIAADDLHKSIIELPAVQKLKELAKGVAKWIKKN